MSKPLPVPPGADLSRSGTIDPNYGFPGFKIPSPTSPQADEARGERHLVVSNPDSMRRSKARRDSATAHAGQAHDEGNGGATVSSPAESHHSSAAVPETPADPDLPAASEPTTPAVTPAASTAAFASYPVPRALLGGPAASTVPTGSTGASTLLSAVSEKTVGKVARDERAVVGALVMGISQTVVNTAFMIALMVVHSQVINWLPTLAGRFAPSSAQAWFDVLVAFQTLMVYHGLFLAAQYVGLALLWDSVRSTNTLELLGFFVFQACSFAYTVVQVVQEQYLDRLIVVAWPDADYGASEGARLYRIHFILSCTILAINGAFLLGWAVLGRRMYVDWGWKKYRRVGADMAVRRRVFWHQLYVLLLKVDLFFFVGFAVQYINMVAGNFFYDPSTGFVAGMSIVAAAVVLVVVAVGLFAARLQSVPLLALFLCGLLAGIGFDSYLFWLVFASPSSFVFDGARGGMSVFMAIALAAAVATLAVSAINLRYFIAGTKLRWKELRLEHGEREARRSTEGLKEGKGEEAGRWGID
ncbi:hypothetical protein DFJ74DRAFT_709785 [Hyaloraphidium curvatum]|nr:hypothetical protein DFJ74DRAFT_709785 [Hyaloraphidium curvatum]